MDFKINKQYALNANEGDSRQAIKWYVIAHESGNEGDTRTSNAVFAEAQYMRRNYKSAYSTHFVGSGGQILQIGTPGFVSWAALAANSYAVAQVELARTNDPKTFQKDYRAYVYILREMAKQYGIPLNLDEGGKNTKGIKTHDWVTKVYGGTHTDPVGYLQRWGISKSQFAKDLRNGLDTFKDKQQAKKQVNSKYDSNNYYKYNPVLVSTNKKIGSFELANLDKQSFNQHIEAGEVLSVKEIKNVGSVSRIKTNKGWISGRKDFTTPYYYTDKDKVNKIQLLDSQLTQYKNSDLTQKCAVLGKGAYDVLQVKETKTNKFSIQLKSKLWITSRKDLVKKIG